MDGDVIVNSIQNKPRHCFLMTMLGEPVPASVTKTRKIIESCCTKNRYNVFDATSFISGRDFLLKIWRMIDASPLAVGVIHEDMPAGTRENICYELGVAQALGKETLIVKSKEVKIMSDMIRTEHLESNKDFETNFSKFLEGLDEQAAHYEVTSDNLDKNPVLSLDYLRRAYLLTGNEALKDKAKNIITESGLENRAKNSVEHLVSSF